jgi:hypothetical protein
MGPISLSSRNAADWNFSCCKLMNLEEGNLQFDDRRHSFV